VAARQLLPFRSDARGGALHAAEGEIRYEVTIDTKKCLWNWPLARVGPALMSENIRCDARKKMIRTVLALLVGSAMSSSLMEPAQAQPQAQSTARDAVPAPPLPVPATVAQLMKGTLYPASNVVFAAQDLNPAEVPRAKDPNMATDLLASSYGKWEAIENSALAIAEVANLLTLPGRKCVNGLEVPLRNADWARFVQELRDAGTMAYAAAQTKNQDKMIDAAGVMTTACQNCHVRYRQKARLEDRCK
jgi:hypothetical protein